MPGYIDNYGTPTNPVVDISASPMTLVLNFQDKGSAAPTDHPIGPFTGLINLSPATLAMLGTPMGQLADKLWAQDKDRSGKTMRDRTSALISGQVSSAVKGLGPGFSAYNISVSLPSTGVMRSIVLTGSLSNPDASQIVFLSYELTGISAGCTATTPFTGGLIPDPAYTLSLDVELLIQIVVPMFPGAFANTASFNVENANISGSNATAEVGDALLTVFNFLTGQPTNIFQAAEGGIDKSGNASNDLGSLGDLLSQLSTAWQAAAPAGGFTKMQAFIDSRPALNFRFIHPLDPAPTVINAAAPPYPSLFRPLLGTSAGSVVAGNPVVVTGTNFPVGQASHLYISWNDTVSGRVTQSDVNWGPVAGPVQSVTITRNGADFKNLFGTPNLLPNTPYTFSVRDEDFLTETPFSAPLTIATQATDLLDFLIAPLTGGEKTAVGSTNLSPTGAFTAVITIPAGLASGSYTLFAVASGVILAFCGIEVGAAGQQLPASIQVIDPATNAVVQTGEESTQFTLRGQGFRPGNANITVDTAAGHVIGTAVVSSAGTFQTSLIWPFGFAGPHSVVADQPDGGPDLQASMSLFIQALPR